MKSVFPWKKFILALTTFSGTIIGVGLFSLPYITAKVGFGIMLIYFLILGAMAILLHLFYGELSLKTPDFKRLPGFAKIYLGNGAKNIALISGIIGMFGALLAYLIVGGEFLGNIFLPIFGGSSLLYTIFYFLIASFLIFLGIKVISKIEFWGLILFFAILIIIFYKGLPLLNIRNLFLPPDFSKLFLPYGPILFSLWGASLIPETEEMLAGDKKLIKKLIIWGILIPIFAYLFFIYLIVGITGAQTNESAISGLSNFLGPNIIALALFLGVITTFTSFITLGLTLRKVFSYDLKINRSLSWAITCFVPLALFLFGVKKFIPVISFVGGVMLGIDAILIILMYQKIKLAKFKFLGLPLILIFVLGIIYEITYFLK